MAPGVGLVRGVVTENAAGNCRLAFIGNDGDLYEVLDRQEPRRLTCGWEEDSDRLYYVWPSYSPDGSQVACFGVRASEDACTEAALYTVSRDGVSMQELWRSHEASPVCESWSPCSKQIALLFEAEQDGLRLDLASLERPGESLALDRGSPLFWAWSPADPFIAVHSGGSRSLSEEARLSVYRVAGGVEEVARLTPGEFRVPAWSPDGRRIAYVDASGGDTEYLALYRLDDGRSEIVCELEGHTVMLWSPDGRMLATSQAVGDSPHVFTGVTLIDVLSGETRVVKDSKLVSFFWAPTSNRLVSMSVEDDRGMEVSVFDLHGQTQDLSLRFFPTRELVYFCQFFDQFASSHPLISADGTSLVIAGHVADTGAAAVEGESVVYLASLIDGSPVERVAPGYFGCWDARVRENGS
ncbi:MAG: TolB family protein [Candidatus Binatia bacterium]